MSNPTREVGGPMTIIVESGRGQANRLGRAGPICASGSTLALAVALGSSLGPVRAACCWWRHRHDVRGRAAGSINVADLASSVSGAGLILWLVDSMCHGLAALVVATNDGLAGDSAMRLVAHFKAFLATTNGPPAAGPASFQTSRRWALLR